MCVINRIIQTLKAKGYTQVDLANALNKKGVTKHTISDWKSGKSKSYYMLIVDIARFLETTTDYLLIGNEYNVANDTTNEKENVIMNEKARNSLKRLTEVYKHFWELAKEEDLLLEASKESYAQARNETLNMLSDLGMTADILREWAVSNFDNSPTIHQLKGLLSVLANKDYKVINELLVNKVKENDKGKYIISDDALYATFMAKCETAINDYKYYIELDSKNRAQKTDVELGQDTDNPAK